jgi:signal transduction histidine kinase
MTEPESPEALLQRRLKRERKARREAEAIAERVTGELYATIGELERVNAELEKANDSIREFVAVASHDIRGPLTVMLGSTQLLRRRLHDLDEAQMNELLAAMEAQGRRLERLVDDLLTISRLEAGAVETHIDEISIALELERVVHEFGDDSVHVRVSASEDLVVLADLDHVHRILVNYLSNALKYGAPPIEARAERNGDYIEVRVLDSGVGVPEDFVHRLFAKFARAEDASARADGTGLGLSIVLGLARANGGDAWYEPNNPTGSCFAVRLPNVNLPLPA